MSIFEILVGAMWRIMRDIASSKTQRYVLANVEKQMSDDYEQYPELFCNIVRTFCAIMTKRAKSSMVEADDDRYPVSDYAFPVHWWDLALARRVYMTKGAIEYAVPYFSFSDEGLKGTILSPAQVKRFFDAYNSGQAEDDTIKVVLAPENFNDSAYLYQFKALVCDGMMTDWNESGTLVDVVAQILDVHVPGDAKYYNTWERYEERSVDKWLMSVR